MGLIGEIGGIYDHGLNSLFEIPPNFTLRGCKNLARPVAHTQRGETLKLDSKKSSSWFKLAFQQCSISVWILVSVAQADWILGHSVLLDWSFHSRLTESTRVCCLVSHRNNTKETLFAQIRRSPGINSKAGSSQQRWVGSFHLVLEWIFRKGSLVIIGRAT